MKSTIVIYGSSTGSCQSIAETIASKLGVEAVDVANIDEATITSHENLFLGTSTWGAGEMQDDWYDGVKTLKSAGKDAQFKQKQRKVNMRGMNCKWLRMSNIS